MPELYFYFDDKLYGQTPWSYPPISSHMLLCSFSFSCNIIMAVGVISSRGVNDCLILILHNCHIIDLKSMKISRTRMWLSKFIKDDGSRVSQAIYDFSYRPDLLTVDND
jgi:hypothetical protein